MHLLGAEEYHESVMAKACTGHHLNRSTATGASLFDFLTVLNFASEYNMLCASLAQSACCRRQY